MSAVQDGFTAAEWQAFGDEAHEHLAALEQRVLAFERGVVEPAELATAFRAAHTIKGGSATLGLHNIASLTHALESRLEELRQGARTVDAPLASALLAATDALGIMLDSAVVTHTDPPPIEDALRALVDIAEAADAKAEPAAPAAEPPSAEPATEPAGAGRVRCQFSAECRMPAVRALQIWMDLESGGLALRSVPSMAEVEAERVEGEFAVWVSAEPAPEVLERLGRLPEIAAVEWAAGAPAVAPPAGQAPAAEAGRGGSPAAGRAAEPEHSVRVDVSLLDSLMNLVGELVTERNRLLRIGQDLHEEQAQNLLQVTGQLARLTESLQETVLKARMLPVDRLFMRFPRLVRDLAHKLDKDVELAILGADAELDRSVIEAIQDPLVHILRNAVDHGIESPQEREAAGKPRTGHIRIMARQEEGHVVVEVSDDGAGLDPARLRQVAVQRGVLAPERAAELPDHAALELIFLQGFSTTGRVSEISGRGVGMDVVRRNIESVGGRVDAAGVPGAGTTITMWLPLTLATVRALLVEAGGQTVALPLAAVAEGLKVGPSAVQHVAGRPAMVVRGRTVPLLSLAEYLECPGGPTPTPLAVLVQVGRELFGLSVDHLLGEQEVVAKALPAFWSPASGIGGVAILADGRPALILDLAGVTKTLTARIA